MIVCITSVGAMKKKISGLLREVKRAKLFEIQRLVRRIRQLAHKKGTEVQLKKNQRKIERFEKDLEFLKDAEVAEIIRKITNKEDKDGREIDEVIEDSTHADIDLRNRALDRIINSTTLTKFLEKVSAGEKDSVEAGQRKSNIDAARPTKSTLRMNLKLKTSSAKRFPAGKSRRKEEHDDDGGINTGIRKKLTKQNAKLRKGTMNESLTSDINPITKPELEEDESYVFLPGSNCSESDFEEDAVDISMLEIKPKGLESCFVQTMSGLEKESMKEKSKPGKEKGKVVNKKKNRKGQRARQQTWEKVHGKSAKHLLKKKIEQRSKETGRTKEQENAKTQHSLKRKSDDESLHPSWEATKRRRLQETLKVEFKGQRIRFDDSE